MLSIPKFGFLIVVNCVTIGIFIFITNIQVVTTHSEDHTLKGTGNKKFVHSINSFVELAKKENEIYEDLKMFLSRSLTTSEDTRSKIERYLEDFAHSESFLTQSSQSSDMGITITKSKFEQLSDQPLLAYRLVYRYVEHLIPMKLKSKRLERHLEYIQTTIGIGLPDKMDLDNAMHGILRLQHVYDLNLTQLISFNIGEEGISLEEKSSVQVTHCFELGKFAIAEGYFAIGIEWLEMANTMATLLLIGNNGNSALVPEVSLEKIEETLDDAISKHNIEWDQMPLSKYDSELFTFKLNGTENEKSNRIKRRRHLAEIYRGERDERFNQLNFWELCCGADMRTEQEISQLFCHYDYKSNAAWFINPLKMEELSHSPELVQIYEAFPPSLIRFLVKTSENRLDKSYSVVGGRIRLSKYRTSMQVWLDDSEIPELRSLSKRVELITGLKTDQRSSEILQVAAYTFGNHFDIHRDVLLSDIKNDVSKDRRIATFMVYLSDVEQGGATAFPQAGIGARPVKGSAVFWYNLKRNGKINDPTWHGGCPVLLGNKWVANKWIQSHDQFLTRPCTLNPED